MPLTPAEGITIHKVRRLNINMKLISQLIDIPYPQSQGGTYATIVVCLKKSVIRSALYVACSRATTLSGLFFEGDFTPPIKLQHDAVELELSRLLSVELKLDADEHSIESHLLSPRDYGKLVKFNQVAQRQANDIFDHPTTPLQISDVHSCVPDHYRTCGEHENNSFLLTSKETCQSTDKLVASS
jgi:hypothetical protein